MTEALAPASFMASETDPKTGSPMWVWPAFFEFTPPTILVPYLIACSVWNVAVFPEDEKHENINKNAVSLHNQISFQDIPVIAQSNCPSEACCLKQAS